MEAKNISFRNFDRFNNRYELAKATPKGAPIQRKGNKDVTRGERKVVSTGKYIALTTFMNYPRVVNAGGFKTVRNSDGNYVILGKNTNKRIAFTEVSKNYVRNTKHIFQEIRYEYPDGTKFTGVRLINDIYNR